MSDAINIEQEVQARVDFKLDELMTGLKNAAAREWHIAFQSGNPKHSHYWEAFEKLKEMLEKERRMPVPYNEMALQKKREARDAAVTEIISVFQQRWVGDPRRRNHETRVVVAAIEKAQNY